jgi:YhfS-like, C-terminal domain/Aminotransferase class I and II
MTTVPLRQWTVPEATDAQFRLVDAFHREFDGYQALDAGDYGAPADLGRSRATARVERVLANFFEAADATLVPGAGSGALRGALMASLRPGASVLVHDFPVYATTAVTFRAMGLAVARCDFNRPDELRTALAAAPDMVYVQHARQRLDDGYDPAAVIALAREVAPDALVLVDDNYTAFAVPRIGCQLGADLSAFSLFKVLGEPGVGCVVGDAGLVAAIRDDHYSGGSKIQGPVAVATLKGVVYAPVALAIQAASTAEIVLRLNDGAVPGVARAHIANHQERGALVEFDEPIAARVAAEAWRFGGAPYPVGSQSRFEVSALFYRLSRAMCEADPALAERMIRVNPFRAGPDTVVRVLADAVAAATSPEAGHGRPGA